MGRSTKLEDSRSEALRPKVVMLMQKQKIEILHEKLTNGSLAKNGVQK